MSSGEIHPNIEKGEAINARNIGFWNSLAHIKEHARVPKIFAYVEYRSHLSSPTIIIIYFFIKVKRPVPGFPIGPESFFYIITYYMSCVKLRPHMAYRSALRGLSGKSGRIWKSLEVARILHMGCAIGKTGLACRRRPVDPLLLYHIEAGLSMPKIAQKNCPLSGQFHELSIKSGTQTEIASQSQASKKVSHSS